MTVGELLAALAEYPPDAVIRLEGCDCTLDAKEVGWCLAAVTDDAWNDVHERRVLIRSGGVSYMKRDVDGNWVDAVGLARAYNTDSEQEGSDASQ